MNARDDIDRVARLWALRERRARETLAERRAAHDAALEALETQRRALEDCQRRFDAAIDARDTEPAPSVETLQRDAVHRRALRRELGQERYYLDVAKGDLRGTARALAAARGDWLRAHARVEQVPTLRARVDDGDASRERRRELAALDERRPSGASVFGDPVT